MNKLLIAAVSLSSLAASAEEVTIKLGTLAPQNSSWHVLLKGMAEDFAAASNGQVKLKIYAGGTQGGEGDMVRKMGVGQLQAGSISAVGLHDIAPEPLTFSTPGLADEDMVKRVLPLVAPRMEAALEAKGYVVLNWAQVGSVRFFCTKPYRTPQEAAQDAKFFVWEGDPASVEAFKAQGFKPVVLATTDITPSLQTGMINCVSQAPAYVLAIRMHEKAGKMLDYPYSFLIGATVVKKETWEKISPELRPKLMAIARKVGTAVDAEVKKLNDDAIVAMEKQGLERVKVDGPAWQATAEKAWPVVRGKVVPADFFDEVVKLKASTAGKK